MTIETLLAEIMELRRLLADGAEREELQRVELAELEEAFFEVQEERDKLLGLDSVPVPKKYA